jgi:hypothetical protein
MSIKRGRPKEQPSQEVLSKYSHEYTDNEGIKAIWKYNLDKTDKGPIEVEFIYPTGWKSAQEKINENNAKLPFKYREYINPVNGKIVGHARAKSLGLI